MDFPKIGHFQYFWTERRWFMVIMVFLWTEWFYSNDPSLTCCPGYWARESCWPMRGRGWCVLTNQRLVVDHPDGPGHPSHSDHRPAVRSERGTRAFLSQIKFVKNKENQKEWETVSSTGRSGYVTSFVYCYCATYFALINLILKPPLCAIASVSLLPILLDRR